MTVVIETVKAREIFDSRETQRWRQMFFYLTVL